MKRRHHSTFKAFELDEECTPVSVTSVGNTEQLFYLQELGSGIFKNSRRREEKITFWWISLMSALLLFYTLKA